MFNFPSLFFFLFSTMFVSLFSFLYFSVDTLFWSCLLFWVLDIFVSNWLIFFFFFFLDFLWSLRNTFILFFFFFFGLFWLSICVCVCLCVSAPLFLSLFVWFCFYHLSGIHFLFPFFFFFFCRYFVLPFLVVIPFIAKIKQLVGSWCLNKNSGLNLWDWSPESRTLGHQGLSISKNSHKGLHLYPRPGTTLLVAEPSARCLI